MPRLRKIIHIDMDAFYASVEQRDNPDLIGKPVIVGGDPDKRGVVAACSYEARRFGIHSAMSSARARSLCPQAVFLYPRFDKYKAVSAQIMEIFHEYTDLVEPLSLDEAFLDVTVNKKGIDSATIIAREIRKEILKGTGLTASAGVSYNKFLAKVASDYRKPDGLTVVTPQKARSFIDRLPIRKFFGVGKVTEKKMLHLGIETGADLRKLSKEELTSAFGKYGSYFYNIAHGLDNRPVTPERVRKSLGKEITLSEDINNFKEMISILEEIAHMVEDQLKRRGLRGRTITLKIKYHDFQSITRSITIPSQTDRADVIMNNIRSLLNDTDAGKIKVRLLGITVSNFQPMQEKTKSDRQLVLPIFHD
jgi:DNA polymerase-4